MIWDLDVYCPRSYRLSHNTSSKVQTQGFKKIFYLKKLKPKDPKLALLPNDMTELLKKNNRKNKKKRF